MISTAGRLASCGVDGEELFEEGLEELEVEGVGGVGLGVRWVVVDFEEEAVDACGDCGAREEGDELGLAAADAVGRRGLLHGVCGIEDDGRERAHDGEGAEIDDEVVVAEGRAALGEEDAFIAGRAYLFEAVGHVPWGDELAFLNVDGAAGAAGGDEQVGLAAKEGGNLEDVDGFGSDLAVGGLMDVSEDGNARIFGDAAEDARAFFEAGAAKTLYAGAIGLVVTGFEDVGNAEISGDALNSFSDGARVSLRLDDAGTGDQEEPARAHLHRADFERRTHEGDSIVPEPTAQPTVVGGQ